MGCHEKLFSLRFFFLLYRNSPGFVSMDSGKVKKSVKKIFNKNFVHLFLMKITTALFSQLSLKLALNIKIIIAIATNKIFFICYSISDLLAKKMPENRAKQAFFELSKSVSFQCYPKIFECIQEKRHQLTAMWSLIFCTLSAFTFYILWTSVTDFYAYETVSKIEVINEDNSDFPTVTICDSNPFSTEYAEKLLLNYSTEIYGEDIRTHGFSKDFHKKISELANLAKLRVTSPIYNNKTALGFSLEQIIYATFDKKEISLSELDFRWIFLHDYGNCLQFNSGFYYNDSRKSIKKTNIQGPSHGLQLVISGTLFNNSFPTTYSEGIILFIHNNTFIPRPEEEIRVQKGAWTNIAVKRTFTENSPYPYSECVDLNDKNTVAKMREMSELFNHTYSNHQKYRQQDCFDLCHQRNIKIECNCFHTKFPNIDPGLEPCYSLSDLRCILDQKETVPHVPYLKCSIGCPLECDWVTYDFQVGLLFYHC